jgi:RNA polymerase sigma-70 factor (ECF subfamily)
VKEEMKVEEFEVIYQKHFKEVYYFTLSLCKDSNLAEDLVHESFLKAMKYAHKLDDVMNLNSWLCKIAKNTFLDYLDRNKKKIALQEMDFQDEVDIEKDFLQKESLKEVHKVLKKLEEPYKEVFLLRIYANLSYKEIGTVFNKSEAWSRQVFHRAKKKIKERL